MLSSDTAGALGTQVPLSHKRIPCVSLPSPTTRRFNCATGAWKLAAIGKPLEVSFDASTRGRIGGAEAAADTSSSAPPLLLPEHSVAELPPSESASESASSGQRQQVLLVLKNLLADELPSVWATGAVNAVKDRFAPDVTFQDPIQRYSGRDAYLWNIRALRAAFDVAYTLHSIEAQEPSQIVARFSMVLRAKVLPWRPTLTITGRTIFSVDTSSGTIMSHREEWDALSDSSYPSLEGFAYVLRSLGKVQLTPELDTPKFTVLKATTEYEIRRYRDFLVASVAMPAGSGPAGGDGFNELAGYIFGGNTRSSKMEMTTPVFSTAGQRNGATGQMSFPMESQYGDNLDALPEPKDPRVERKVQKGAVVAALSFPGLPLDWEVTAAERQLRGALLLDGLKPRPGYRLARYNEPYVPPPLKRNEVLIECEGFEM